MNNVIRKQRILPMKRANQNLRKIQITDRGITQEEVQTDENEIDNPGNKKRNIQTFEQLFRHKHGSVCRKDTKSEWQLSYPDSGFL